MVAPNFISWGIWCVVTCKSYCRPELAFRPPDKAFSPQRIEYGSSFFTGRNFKANLTMVCQEHIKRGSMSNTDLKQRFCFQHTAHSSATSGSRRTNRRSCRWTRPSGSGSLRGGTWCVSGPRHTTAPSWRSWRRARAAQRRTAACSAYQRRRTSWITSQSSTLLRTGGSVKETYLKRPARFWCPPSYWIICLLVLFSLCSRYSLPLKAKGGGGGLEPSAVRLHRKSLLLFSERKSGFCCTGTWL